MTDEEILAKHRQRYQELLLNEARQDKEEREAWERSKERGFFHTIDRFLGWFCENRVVKAFEKKALFPLLMGANTMLVVGIAPLAKEPAVSLMTWVIAALGIAVTAHSLTKKAKP